jgi:hypothetical protein
MAAVFLLFIFCHGRDARAAPATTLETQIQQADSNITALNNEIAPSWATTRNIRGTKDLLWTSVLTLFICVYTVVHLNVPPPNEGPVGFMLRKTKWVLISILAPEISLAMAMQQWLVARALSKDLTKLWNDSHREKQLRPKQMCPLSKELSLHICKCQESRRARAEVSTCFMATMRQWEDLSPMFHQCMTV